MIKNQKTLIVGSSGQIGNYLFQKASDEDFQVFGTYYSQKKNSPNQYFLDISDKDNFFIFLDELRPQTIFFPAFNANVDECERHPGKTKKVNVDPLEPLVDYCKKNNSSLIYFSTDYVFDGKNGPYKENDRCMPLSVYGMQKLEAEEAISTYLKNYIIARVSWVFGKEEKEKNFVIRLIRALQKSEKVKVPGDQFSTPTFAGHLTDSLFKLIELDFSGTIHISSKDTISKYNFALEVANFFNLDTSLIEEVKTDLNFWPAPRPEKSGLKTTLLSSILKEETPTLSKNLDTFSKQLF